MENKNSIGRPSKYDPSYCAQIIQSGERGEYIAEFIAEIGVKDSKTLRNWCEEYPEFKEAYIDAAWKRLATKLKLARRANSEVEFRKDVKNLYFEAFLVSKPLRTANLDVDIEDLELVLDKGGNTYNIKGNINQIKIDLTPEERQYRIKELIADPEIQKLLTAQEVEVEVIDQ